MLPCHQSHAGSVQLQQWGPVPRAVREQPSRAELHPEWEPGHQQLLQRLEQSFRGTRMEQTQVFLQFGATPCPAHPAEGRLCQRGLETASGGHAVQLPTLVLVFPTNLSPFVQMTRGTALSKPGSAPFFTEERFSHSRSPSWPRSISQEKVLLLFSSCSVFCSLLACLELIFNFQCHWSLQGWSSLLACFLLLSWFLQSLGGKEKLK